MSFKKTSITHDMFSFDNNVPEKLHNKIGHIQLRTKLRIYSYGNKAHSKNEMLFITLNEITTKEHIDDALKILFQEISREIFDNIKGENNEL